MILNQTPIRTSNNYKINNIELDIEMPKKQEEFEGLTIFGDTSNFKISNSTSKQPLIYGNGKELENQIFENANQNIKIEETKTGNLYLEFNLNEENSTLVENIEIEANTKSKTTIYIKYLSDDNFECFHNGILRVNAKPDSKTNIVVINMLNDYTTNLLSIENILEESSNVNYTIVDFGGKTSITNYYSKLEGKGSKANINTIYLGKDEQVFDITISLNFLEKIQRLELKFKEH